MLCCRLAGWGIALENTDLLRMVSLKLTLQL